jgi:hypothetical protein
MWAKNAGKLYMAKYSLAKEELPQPKDGFFSPSPSGGFSECHHRGLLERVWDRCVRGMEDKEDTVGGL